MQQSYIISIKSHTKELFLIWLFIAANKFFKIINTKYIRNLETKDEELTLRKERKIKSFFSKIFRKKK